VRVDSEARMHERFKVCTCGHIYTIEEWRSLPRLGEVVDPEREAPSEPDETPLPAFELRTCRLCGSTISKAVPYVGGTDYPPPQRR
jgi:hypothetical protein